MVLSHFCLLSSTVSNLFVYSHKRYISLITSNSPFTFAAVQLFLLGKEDIDYGTLSSYLVDESEPIDKTTIHTPNSVK